MNKKICERLIRKENRQDGSYTYSYELLMSEGDMVANFRLPLYSVRVKMTDINGEEREASAKDVFSRKSEATAFFEKIVRNLATPIDLAYILEDEMA
ncbi:MAG: hypothetical protein IJX97_00780 [Clostridia bacterium]|nr:hypothetical protein [Clostridia bacterium]